MTSKYVYPHQVATCISLSQRTTNSSSPGSNSTGTSAGRPVELQSSPQSASCIMKSPSSSSSSSYEMEEPFGANSLEYEVLMYSPEKEDRHCRDDEDNYYDEMVVTSAKSSTPPQKKRRIVTMENEHICDSVTITVALSQQRLLDETQKRKQAEANLDECGRKLEDLEARYERLQDEIRTTMKTNREDKSVESRLPSPRERQFENVLRDRGLTVSFPRNTLQHKCRIPGSNKEDCEKEVKEESRGISHEPRVPSNTNNDRDGYGSADSSSSISHKTASSSLKLLLQKLTQNDHTATYMQQAIEEPEKKECKRKKIEQKEFTATSTTTTTTVILEACHREVDDKLNQLNDIRKVIFDLEISLANEKLVAASIKSEAKTMECELQNQLRAMHSSLQVTNQKMQNSDTQKKVVEFTLAEEMQRHAKTETILSHLRAQLNDTMNEIVTLKCENEAAKARTMKLTTTFKDSLKKGTSQLSKVRAELNQAQKRESKLENDFVREQGLRKEKESEVEKLTQTIKEQQAFFSRQQSDSDNEDEGLIEEDGNIGLTQMVTGFSKKVDPIAHDSDKKRVRDLMAEVRRLLEKSLNTHLQVHLHMTEKQTQARNIGIIDKIHLLRDKGRFPSELVSAMHVMRKIGNDETHCKTIASRDHLTSAMANFTRLEDLFDNGDLPLERSLPPPPQDYGCFSTRRPRQVRFG